MNETNTNTLKWHERITPRIQSYLDIHYEDSNGEGYIKHHKRGGKMTKLTVLKLIQAGLDLWGFPKWNEAILTHTLDVYKKDIDAFEREKVGHYKFKPTLNSYDVYSDTNSPEVLK